MIKTDLSTEALLARREVAEKATPGPWEKDGDDIYTVWSREEYPERGYEAEVEGFSEIRVATTENYSPDISDDETAGNASHIAANSPDVVIATIDELLRLREDNERLEKEADWLALKAWKKRDSEYMPEREHECLECPFDHDCVKCWREAARRAVEKEVC